MHGERVRRLAAVWFADIVGYTTLSSRHEDAALAVVEEFQEASREAVGAHGGRIVKFVGDAALAVFDSADGALRAAFALRRAFQAAPTAHAHACELTLGVHLGEVVEADDGDVYGDGVNVASRVQGKAGPSQIVATRAVVDLIRGRPEYQIQALPPWIRLKGLGFAQLFTLAEAGERLPPRRVTVGRAIAVGSTVGLVTFGGMVVANGFSGARSGADGPAVETPPAPAAMAAADALDLGVEHYFAGELDRAVETLAPFAGPPLRDTPEAEEALRYLARAHLEAAEADKARGALDQLVNAEPPMELLIPSAEDDALIELYYGVRLDARRAPAGTPVEGIIVFDLLVAADTGEAALADVGPSVSQMLLSELELQGLAVRYPWEVMLGYTGEGAYRYFDERILGAGTPRATHALFGRIAVREGQLLLSGRVYELVTGAQVVSRTVTGVWPDGLFGLVEELGAALGGELKERAGETPAR